MSDSNSSLNNIPEDIITEACVGTIDDALQAQQNGAHQLEWCGDLSKDGLTPDRDLTVSLLQKIHIPVKVMIRCRPGDFVYSDEEMNRMSEDAAYFSSLTGVSGIVFGATHPDHTLNLNFIKQIVGRSNGLPMTLHKAIDVCDDILTEIKKVSDIPGVRYILSSGGRETAMDGVEMLIKMQGLFSGKIIAAGKINRQNLATLHRLISFQYYHGKQIVNNYPSRN